MAVNGIDLAVGQTWRTERDHLVTIISKSESSLLKWKTNFRMLSGEHALCNDLGTMTNLDVLVDLADIDSRWTRHAGDEPFPPIVDPLPDYYEALTAHALPAAEPEQSNEVVSAQTNDGQPLPFDDIQPVGIGDITSTAKGSGARYNTGKPPLDLVPLSLLAGYHQHRPDYDALSDEQKSAIAALDALGMFQAREGKLLEVLYALGDGWDECAQVFEYGRRKYAAWNWAKGMPLSVPIACAARHLRAIIRGEHTDPESGLSHRGHVFCNIVMLGTYMGTFTEGDDRPAKGMLL